MISISYALLTLVIEDFLIKKDLSGIQLGKANAAILLAFADGMYFLSESWVNEKKNLEEYFELNGLEINIEKTKANIF